MKKDYNIVVIGAGSGGLVTAYIGAAVKAKVALIEKNKMGGDCLNTGCVPSKALLRTTSVLAQIKRHKDFGLRTASADFDFAEVMERVQSTIKKIEPHDSVERYTALGVDCYQGAGKIISPHEVEVGGKILTTKNIVIAAGGKPRIPDIDGLDQITALDTESLWQLREQPGHLIIVGGGPIGCEIGQAFTRLGTRVTLIQRHDQILPREDADVADILAKRLNRECVHIRTNTTARQIQVRDGKKYLVVDSGGHEESIAFDEILFASGRQAEVSGLGLDKVGIDINADGLISTDAFGRTNIKNIFACGDIASPYQFTHMAAHQAWYAAVNALFQPFKKFKIDWSLIPWCTYSDPEVARLGLNEKEARQNGIAYEVTAYPLNDLDRAITDSETEGMVKVLTVPGKDKILGVTICGYHAGDLLPEFILAKKLGAGLNQILSTIHMYPTMAEANKYAAGVWKKAHAPEVLLKWIEKFHNWRRG